MTAASSRETPVVWILEMPKGTSPLPSDDVRAFGLSARQRLERTLARAGAGPVDDWPLTRSLAETDAGSAVLFRDDCFYDERLVCALLETTETLLCQPGADGEPREPVAARVEQSHRAAALEALRNRQSDALPDAVSHSTSADLVPAYNPQLRKFDPAFVFPASPESVREAENRIFAASYKGITDFITKHVFPAPALAVVRVLAALGVKPNTVTLVSYALTAAVVLLFARGDFALGLLMAWAMTFLDTVDGKLARVTLTSSRLGGFLDHALDLVHPPIWWWAFAVGLGMQNAGVEAAMLVIVGGYVVGRILEGIFLLAFGMEVFTWRPFDAFFRGIIARRNPNLLLLSLGCVVARPEWGYMAVAIWTAICIAVASARIVQAATQRMRGHAIQPWHEQSTSPATGPA